jgi:phospholipid transport system substrate-binding protein
MMAKTKEEMKKMRIHKILLTYIMVLFAWFAPVTMTQAAPTGDPVALLQYIADNMIAGLKSNQATLKTKPSIVYSLAHQYVVPYADLSEMSKRVLPPSVWNSATPGQRSAFEKQFTTLLIRTYASALTSYKDQTVKFYPVRGASGQTVQVSSDIVSPQSSPIHVTYRLIRVGGGWRLFDMSVEGVSLIESFRSQFADILSHGNMDQLISQMSGHNTR